MDTHQSNRSAWIAGIVVLVSVAGLALLLVTRQRFGASPSTMDPKIISALVTDARQLTDQQRYAEALAVVDQIIALDPKNDYALGARPLIADRAMIMQQRQGPNPDRTTASDRGLRATDAEVLAKLDRKLPEIKFAAVGFENVVDFLRDVSSANIFVNWTALENAGVPRTTPVTARLRDVKFAKALEIILRDVGGGNVKLGYSVTEGVITISTQADLDRNVVTNVYDIRDLLVVQPGMTGGGGGGNVFQNPRTAPAQPQNRRKQIVDEVINLIQETVASDSWTINGGNVGTIREIAGQLLITHTPDTHRQVTRLIEQLRETRSTTKPDRP